MDARVKKESICDRVKIGLSEKAKKGELLEGEVGVNLLQESRSNRVAFISAILGSKRCPAHRGIFSGTKYRYFCFALNSNFCSSCLRHHY